MKKNVLVTGGAGFIGSHLVEKLVGSGYHVRVLDNLSTGTLANLSSELIQSGKVDFVKGDIRDTELVDSCVRAANAVIHLAAQISVPLSIQDPVFNNDVNIKGTSNLLQSSVKTKLAKFIFISSCAVYGEPTYLPVDEKHPTNPISPYAESKLISEQECLRLNSKHLLKTVIVRFFNVYGPRQGINDYSGVITKFMEKIKQKKPLTIYGYGSQTRDFVYVQDVVNAIVLALEKEDANGQVYNIGTGKAVTIEDLAKTLLSINAAELDIIKAPERQGDIKHSYANIAKANNTLGYKPKYTLREGLTQLLKQNGLID